MKISLKYTIILIIAFFGISSCASFTLGNKDPEAMVRKNIIALMKVKIDGDWAKVYDFFDSNFKKQIKRKAFDHGNKAIFKSYHIEYIKVDPSGEWVDALVKQDMIVRSYNLKGVPEKQHWIKEKGKWVLVVKPAGNFID